MKWRLGEQSCKEAFGTAGLRTAAHSQGAAQEHRAHSLSRCRRLQPGGWALCRSKSARDPVSRAAEAVISDASALSLTRWLKTDKPPWFNIYQAICKALFARETEDARAAGCNYSALKGRAAPAAAHTTTSPPVGLGHARRGPGRASPASPRRSRSPARAPWRRRRPRGRWRARSRGWWRTAPAPSSRPPRRRGRAAAARRGPGRRATGRRRPSHRPAGRSAERGQLGPSGSGRAPVPRPLPGEGGNARGLGAFSSHTSGIASSNCGNQSQESPGRKIQGMTTGNGLLKQGGLSSPACSASPSHLLLRPLGWQGVEVSTRAGFQLRKKSIRALAALPAQLPADRGTITLTKKEKWGERGCRKTNSEPLEKAPPHTF